MEMLLCTANPADDATLSGGDFTTGLPRDNLKDERVTKVARTSSTDEADTRFRADLGANYTLRALALVNNNFSTGALWRVRAGQSPFDVLFDREGYVDERLTCSGGANGTRVNSLGVVVAATCPRIDHSPVNLASGTATQTVASVPAGRYVLVTVGAGSMVVAGGATLESPAWAFPGNNGIVVVQSAGDVVLTVTGSPTALHFREVYGVLAEEDRENLITYSADFSNAAWVKAAFGTGSVPVVTPNNAIAPDGTMTADTIVFDVGAGTTTSDQSFIYQTATVSSGQAHAGSVYVKGAAGTKLVMRHVGGAAYTLITLTGEWDRVSSVETSISTSADFTFGLMQGVLGTLNATATVAVWGADLQAGSSVLSHIPTTSAAVTRSADSITATSTNFSSWFNASAGTFYAEARPSASASTYRGILSANDGSSVNVIQVLAQPSTNNFAGEVYDGVTQASMVGGAISAGASIKCAIGYAAADFASCFNGGSVVTSSASVAWSVSQLSLGTLNGSDFPLNGHVSRLTYWRSKFSGAAMQAITTSGPDIAAVGGWCSGTTACKQMTFYGDTPADWAAQYPAMVAFSAVSARYATVELIDTANADGYVQMGRLFVGGGMAFDNEADSQGFAFDREELSTVQQTATGRRIGYERRRPRGVVFRLPAITQAQSDQIHEMQALVGTIGEVLLVTDTDDMAFSQRYGGIGYLRDLSPIEYPLPDHRSVAFSWREKL